MWPQIACPNRSKVALVAFVWLFYTVRFQMFPQRAWIWKGKVTLVAFVLTFLYCPLSNVFSKSLDLNRQSHIGCICSNFSIVRFQMCAQIAWPNIGYTCLFDFSPLCIFKCFLKELGFEKAAHLGEMVAGQAEPVHQSKRLEIAGQISCILSPQDRSVVRDDQIFWILGPRSSTQLVAWFAAPASSLHHRIRRRGRQRQGRYPQRGWEPSSSYCPPPPSPSPAPSSPAGSG